MHPPFGGESARDKVGGAKFEAKVEDLIEFGPRLQFKVLPEIGDFKESLPAREYRGNSLRSWPCRNRR
jgi:hypothetical protein